MEERMLVVLVHVAVPRLATFGLSPADFPAIAAQSLKASSMKANPLPLTAAEVIGILEAESRV